MLDKVAVGSGMTVSFFGSFGSHLIPVLLDRGQNRGRRGKMKH